MDLGIVSTRYAKALLLLAVELGEEKTVYAQTQRLGRALLKIPTFSEALGNPVVTDDVKRKLISSAVADTNGLTGMALPRFVDLLLRHKRIELLNFIAHSYGTLYRKRAHLVEGELIVASSAAVDDKIVERMKELVSRRTKKDVSFRVTTDEAIGGGFILQYDTYRLDASVRSRFRNYHKELVEAPASASTH